MNWFYKTVKKHRDLLIYLIFGVLTTLVNYAVYLPLVNLTSVPASVCNAAAWAVSVAFAFLTNKPFVFKSHDWSAKTVLSELAGFVVCRLGSGALETMLIFVLVDWLTFDGNMIKLITGVLVVVLNYIGSKLLVFRKK